MSETSGAKGAGGASQGAAPADLSEGQGTGGAPKAPEIATREGLDEEHGSPEPKAKPEGKPAKEPAKPREAAPETPADPPEPEQGSDEWHKQFIQTGNEHADSAIDLMKEAGVSPIEANAVFQKAIESGKLDDVNWKILEDKIGKGKTALVKAGVEAFYNNEYKGRMETVGKAHEIMGSEAGWNTVRDWAQKAEKADPALKSKVDNIRAAIDLGGFAAEAAIRELRSMYEAAPGTKGLGTQKVTQGTKAAPQVEGSALSRNDYLAERRKLAEAGHPDSSPQVRALMLRRKAGQQAGI